MRGTTTSEARATSREDLWRGVYRIIDPKITLASVASLIVGACAAAADGPLSWTWLAVTAIGVFFMEAAKNASGELFDWDSGAARAVAVAERTPFSGGRRVIVDRLLTREHTALVATVFYGLAAITGMLIVLVREPAVLWLGAAGAALAFFYLAPPLKLAYRGVGELAVALGYGPLVATGTYLVQRGHLGRDVLLSSLPLGIAIMAFFWLNEVPDRRADALVGKNTLVVRLALPAAAKGFAMLVGAAFAMVMVLPALGLPIATWLGLVGLPFGVAAARRLRWFAADPAARPLATLIPAQGWTLLSFLLMAMGLGAGLLLPP